MERCDHVVRLAHVLHRRRKCEAEAPQVLRQRPRGRPIHVEQELGMLGVRVAGPTGGGCRRRRRAKGDEALIQRSPLRVQKARALRVVRGEEATNIVRYEALKKLASVAAAAVE